MPKNGTSGTSGSGLSSFPHSSPPSNMTINGTSRPLRTAKLHMFDIKRHSTSRSPTPSSIVSSQQSSFSTRLEPSLPELPRRLRSQYPRTGVENHVEYILVASFHVDRGPIMEHQFPGAISGDEHMLAELMLPDQAHVRNQDWTIFFLHKDTSQDEGSESHEAQKRRKGWKRDHGPGSLQDDSESYNGSVGTDERSVEPRLRQAIEEGHISHEDGDSQDQISDAHLDAEDTDQEGDIEDWDEGGTMDCVEPAPLIYVLNLVNTKQDNTVKRGAVVKAMAICTRHSFLHIYKPLLLLALEEYFKSPFQETLASLYHAVNSMDLSLMPKLTVLERYILQSSDTKDLFLEKFEQMIQQRMAEEQQGAFTIETSENPDDTARSDTTGLPPPPHYTLPRDTHEFESRVLYNGIPIPIKVPVAISPETVGDFSLIKLIQAFSVPHAKEPQPFMLHSHLTTGGAYTHPIIVLVNAMLTEKRVIFLGHNRPSGEVAEAVLAACALASGGILRGYTRHAFPYTDLTKIDDLLKVSGFVAGVTNPAFANHPEWWDLLCDIPSGRMKISNRIDPAPATDGLLYFQQQNPGLATGVSPSAAGADATGDVAFMDDILRSIASRHGEANIRAKWREWVVKFTRIAAAFEESVYGASALHIGGDEADTSIGGVSGHGYVWGDETSRLRELAGGVSRIEGWRNTRSYYSFIQDLAQLYTIRPIKSIDLHHLHDRLRTQKLSAPASASIYHALSHHIHSYDEICQLLTVTPESHAGLFYVSLGLFHPGAEVRVKTVELLGRVESHAAGRHFWAGLSWFAKLAYIRIQREILAKEEGRSQRDEGEGIDARIKGSSVVGRAS
ncbi:MAG: hypothetical protein M1829_005300 [Trizodia sp. TS-e1964]|nr:MAG: hypothetical protein M1829_005300 [Trizodia sp. TS-e1964]